MIAGILSQDSGVVLAGLVRMVAWGTRGLDGRPRRLSGDSVKLPEQRDLCRINTITNTTSGSDCWTVFLTFNALD